MQLAARSYLAAGVALVGASAIAVSPLAPAAPQVHVPVALTAAIDNPVTVFSPVATATQSLIDTIVTRATTNPSPVAAQLADNAVGAYQSFMSTPPAWAIAYALTKVVVGAQNFGPNLQAINDANAAAGPALIEALSELAAGLPSSLQAAGEQFAEGNPGAAIDAIILPGLQPFINILMFSVSPELNAWGQMLGVPQPLIDAGLNAILGGGLALAMSTVGIGYDLPGPQPLVKQVLIGAQSVANAVKTGDPINVVNAMQHSTSDLISTTISQVESTFSMANNLEDSFADALRQIKPKPFTPPDIDLPDTATAQVAAAAAPKALTATAVTATVDKAPADQAPETNADKASDTAAASDDTTSTAAASTESTDAKPAPKVAAKAAVKKPAKANTSANTVRDQVKSAVKKVTNGFKKDKAEKKADSHSSAKGADSK